MSLTFVSLAIESSLVVEKKFVLMLLADNCDQDGKGSVDLLNIAETCGFDLEHTTKLVDSLIFSGIITHYDFSQERPRSGVFDFQIIHTHGVFNRERPVL